MQLTESQIQTFRDRGFLVFDPGIPISIIDGVVRDMAPYWEGREPVGATTWNNTRIQDAWKISAKVKALATFAPILSALRQLYGRRALPFQTLNFKNGTEQRPHSDSVHFNSEPFGMMCGVWVALEDVGADQGPLIYYPGSHKLPEMNFDDLGIVPDYANYRQYEDAIESLIKEKSLEPELGVISKSQALIWSANILHGGFNRNNRDLTRWSQVTHYYFSGCRYWRPGQSPQGRFYFEPDWIPHDVTSLLLRGKSDLMNAIKQAKQWLRSRLH